MAKILITGGAGFIGSHLAEKLLQKGETVFVLDNLSTGRKENIEHFLANEKFHFQEGSVLDEKIVSKLVAEVEQIYHLAAAVGVKRILGRPLDSLLTNIKGTEIVLAQAAKGNIKTLVASSSEVCGKSEKVPFKEDDDRTYGSVFNDRWVYAFSKAVDEFLALAYWRERKLPVVVVRLFNVIGPRQTGTYGMVVPTFVRQAFRGEPITVFGDGQQTRCFADIADVIEALVKLMETKEAEGQLFNLGSDEEVSINELAKKVKELTASSSEVIHLPYEQAYRQGYEDMRRRVPDLTRVQKLIGYQPRVSLEESIRKIIKEMTND